MAAFPLALQTIRQRTYGGRQSAFAAASGLNQVEIGRLIREETPVTNIKLSKLCQAEGLTDDDRSLLIHAAVRDYVGEAEYTARFTPHSSIPNKLDGTQFASLFPISPRAERALRHLVGNASTNVHICAALELFSRIIEPEAPPKASPSNHTVIHHGIAPAVTPI